MEQSLQTITPQQVRGVLNSTILRTTCAQNGLPLTDQQLHLLEAYAHGLLEWNKKINLISRRDEEGFWTRHLLHSLSMLFKLEIPEGMRVLDLGTGGGLPGVVLKIARPDLQFTLLDSTQKKVNVVSGLIASLGLVGIQAVWGRAEDLGKKREYEGRYDVVVARAVGPLKNLVRWSYPFLKRAATKGNVERRAESGLEKKRIAGPALVAFKGGDIEGEIGQLRNQPNIGPISTVELTLKGSTQLDDGSKKLVVVEYVRSDKQKAEQSVSDQKELFEQLTRLSTEQRNPVSMDIDAQSISEILQTINSEDKKVAVAVQGELEYVGKAVELVVRSLRSGGRLLYVGAGTSGRLGVIDAAECPPTYGTPPETVQGMIAGGEKAMFRSQEGAEDKQENGARDIDERSITKSDVVCGIAASLRTPYVIGAVKRAKQLGAKTLYVTTNPRSRFYSPEFTEIAEVVDVAICPEVGPEVIMGSTRMKSGTAQKLVLNMITTAAMIRLGKVYENMMIDLQMTNQKLRERSKRIVMTITGVGYEEAADYLDRAGGHVKTALVMIKARVDRAEAQRRLERADGFVRAAIDNKEYKIV